jgi:hypothetical protein
MKSECVALLLVLACCAGARSATFYVDDNAPGDPRAYDPNFSDPQEDGSAQHPFDSIQEAIDRAANSDTIIVAPGRYLSQDPWAYAELLFKGKSVRLVSSAPTDFSVAEQTILCGVVIFQGNEAPNCLLQGFKIQNHDCGGILGNKTQASVSHCIISGNGPCGATVVKDVYGRLANCLVVDNTTFHDCGVLPVVSGCPTLVNCTIANNASCVEFYLLGRSTADPITIHNCILWGNQGAWAIAGTATVEYCLLENWEPHDPVFRLLWPSFREDTLLGADADPCFVRLGRWEDPPSNPLSRPARGNPTTTPETPRKVLIEGDYHLCSAGWRWGPQEVHGSHWYFDPVTSPAIDAGDPMDSLGEELEHIPDDPEGRWGVNHAIDLGAYGGTAQASLSPTRGEAPGVGAVDFQDYWPTSTHNSWTVLSPQGIARVISVAGTFSGGYGPVYSLATSNAPEWAGGIYCYRAGRVFYMTQDYVSGAQPLEPPRRVQAQYPQYPVVDATIQAPYDPFAKAPVEYRSVLVVRGALAEVLAGTNMDPNQFLAGAWPDVIAFREIGGDGSPGDPIAIFARGFGPLLLAGQPVEGAVVGSRTFGSVLGLATSAIR